jgi:hypothetical protein
MTRTTFPIGAAMEAVEWRRARRKRETVNRRRIVMSIHGDAGSEERGGNGGAEAPAGWAKAM